MNYDIIYEQFCQLHIPFSQKYNYDNIIQHHINYNESKQLFKLI